MDTLLSTIHIKTPSIMYGRVATLNPREMLYQLHELYEVVETGQLTRPEDTSTTNQEPYSLCCHVSSGHQLFLGVKVVEMNVDQ